MKATPEEIEDYIYMVFMTYSFDYNGYLALMRHKEKCIKEGRVIPL